MEPSTAQQELQACAGDALEGCRLLQQGSFLTSVPPPTSFCLLFTHCSGRRPSFNPPPTVDDQSQGSRYDF